MKKITLYLFGILLMSSCLTDPNFSNVPEISYNTQTIITTQTPDALGNITLRDSVILSINFQDGDGNLGITQGEFAGTTVTNPSVKGLKVYDLKLYVQKNGVFKESSPAIPLSGSGYIPFHFKTSSKAGPIEGIIDYSMTFNYKNFSYIPLLTGKKDTIRFDVWIRDRTLNTSNIVQTPPIVLFNK